MQSLLISYQTLLCDNGCTWVLQNSKRTAVTHVISAIKPDHLKSRLSEELEFAHYDLRKDLKGFLKHKVKVEEAFQIVDNGRKPSSAGT